MTNEKAIEVIRGNCYVFNPMNLDRTTLVNTALDMAIKALEQRWIPVTERLPKEWNSVLITFSGKYGNLTAVHAVGTGSLDGINGWYFDEIDGYTERLKVEAWMPLPEPYKAESKLNGDPIDIDKAVEHYEGTLETLKGIDLEVDA